jgi:hypothetical protein
MDTALASQQQRAEAWQAKLDAKDARLTELDAKLQVWLAIGNAWDSPQPFKTASVSGRVLARHLAPTCCNFSFANIEPSMSASFACSHNS